MPIDVIVSTDLKKNYLLATFCLYFDLYLMSYVAARASACEIVRYLFDSVRDTVQRTIVLH